MMLVLVSLRFPGYVSYSGNLIISLSPSSIHAPLLSLVFVLFLFNCYCYSQCSHVLLQISWYCSQSANEFDYHSGFNLPEPLNFLCQLLIFVHFLLLRFVDSCVSRHCNVYYQCPVVVFVYNYNGWSLSLSLLLPLLNTYFI